MKAVNSVLDFPIVWDRIVLIVILFEFHFLTCPQLLWCRWWVAILSDWKGQLLRTISWRSSSVIE
jgi:hypothetical protein